MALNLREISTAAFVRSNTAKTLSGQGAGYLFALFGTVLFSSKAIFVKLLYQPHAGQTENALDAITIMALRLGFSAPVYICLLIYLIHLARTRHEPLPHLADILRAFFLGMLGYYVCAWLDIEGLKYITSQLERLLLFTYPIFVFVFGAMFFGHALTRGALVAIALAYAGIGVIFLGGNIAIGANVPLGTALVLSCAALFAIFQLFSKPMITRLSSPMFTCLAMLGAGCAIFLHFIIQHSLSGSLSTALDLTPRTWALGLTLATFSTLIPSFLVNMGIARIGPQATSAMGMVSPVATILLAIWLLSEPFGWGDALGTSLTIIGIAIYTWQDRRVQTQPSKTAPRER